MGDRVSLTYGLQVSRKAFNVVFSIFIALGATVTWIIISLIREMYDELQADQLYSCYNMCLKFHVHCGSRASFVIVY